MFDRVQEGIGTYKMKQHTLSLHEDEQYSNTSYPCAATVLRETIIGTCGESVKIWGTQ